MMTPQHNVNDALFEWFERNFAALHRAAILPRFDYPDADSARIDFESETTVARVTVWRDGVADFEILDADSYLPIRRQHEPAVTVGTLPALLDAFVNQLAGE